MERLVAYCSEEAHSSVEKAARLAAVRLRRLPVGDAASSADEVRRCSPFWRSLAAETLQRAVEQDLREGRVPFYVRLYVYVYSYFIECVLGLRQLVVTIWSQQFGRRAFDRRQFGRRSKSTCGGLRPPYPHFPQSGASPPNPPNVNTPSKPSINY